MSIVANRESINLQEIDVELVISSKIYLKKTAKIIELKNLACREFKQYGIGHEFDYFVTDHILEPEEDQNEIESLAPYRTNKIVLKPSQSYKNQYEEVRRTLEDDEDGKIFDKE